MSVRDVDIGGKGCIPIRNFKLEYMEKNPAIVMIAKRRSGKSWVTRSILKHFRHIPVGIVIAPTDRMNRFYGDFFPDLYIYYQYKTEIIQKLLRRQEDMIEKNKEKILLGKRIDPRAFIVMDDCLSDKRSWMKDQPISELLFNGRHYEIMYILTMQFALGITPDMRNQFDYVFLLKEDKFTNLKRIYDHYAGMFPTFDSFRQVFSQLTEEHGCMVVTTNEVVDKKKPKVKVPPFLNQIFWYKAGNDSVEGIGCKQFQDCHRLNYDENWKKRLRELDVNAYIMQKKKDKTSVKIDKKN